MAKRFLAALLLVGFAAPSAAELCTIDAVPAATLLLPYFEVNLAKRSKTEETLFSINNADAAPTIAHVVVWTDASIPTLAFDVFLTGYDVQSISLIDLFFDGQLPESVSGITGLTDLGDLRNAHSGRSVDGECWGRRLSGNKARGYITIDNANQEFPFFPNDSSYFSGNEISEVNQLWGEYFTFTKKYIEQERLVSIEAGSFTGPTFYGRYSSGEDRREPLGTTWGARWFSGSSKTHLIVWRDSLQDVGPFACGELESTGAYPLGTTQLVIFDEQEDATEISNELPFPVETQIVQVGSSDLPTFGYGSGWIYLNLNLPGEGISQSYVTVRQDFRSRRSRAAALLFSHAGDGQAASRTRPRVSGR